MAMGTLESRPSLPQETPVGEGFAVRRPLYARSGAELYLLDGSSSQNAILLMVLESATRFAGFEAHTDWWASLSEQGVRVLRSWTEPRIAREAFAAVLDVPGACARESAGAFEEDQPLQVLTTHLLNLAKDGVASEVYPVLDPGALFLTTDEAHVGALPLLLYSEETGTQIDIVRSVGRLLYWLGAGIRLPNEPSEGDLPLIRQWAPGVSLGLSSVAVRSLRSPEHSDAILTVEQLRESLRHAADGSAPTYQSPTVGEHTNSDRHARTGMAAVAGMHELKELLQQEVIAPLRNPEPYRAYGLNIPNGILLYGPPGCGKTYIANKLAEELGHRFKHVTPSEIASPYVHQSVLKIRDMFDTAREEAPAILFIDEFEALVPERSSLGGHQQHKSEEVNEFLANLEGCAEAGVLVIAATNEPHKIDPAVRRSGRLDKLVYVGPPDRQARAEMLEHHLADRPAAEDLDPASLALHFEGYSAADLRLLVDEAARRALKASEPISAAILLEAQGRVAPSVTPEIEDYFRSFGSRGV